jgi:cell wall-associated NlpC family hydrolase
MTLFGDPFAALNSTNATASNRISGTGFSPDNWLVSQVEQLPTPAFPIEGPTTRNEPHTVPAPQGAAIGIGGSLGATGNIGAAINAAMGWVGTMYDWGGNGQNGRGVDCSGLLYAAFKSAGFNMQRYRAVDYGHMGVAVDASAAMPGDIVYFDNPNSDTDHVGLYIGDGKYIQAPSTGQRVQVSNYKGGGQIRRVLPASAYRALPRTIEGNAVVSTPTQSFTASQAPGPQFDPLDIIAGLQQGASPSALMGLPPDIIQGIAAQTPAIAHDGTANTKHPADQFQSFLDALGMQESGGQYNIRNSIGAIGKYQVMSGNVGSWTLQALGYTMSPDEFQHSPAAQEAVARWKLGSLVAQYGYRGAAAAWYSGQAKRESDYSHVSNGPSVGDYVDQVLGRMG